MIGLLLVLAASDKTVEVWGADMGVSVTRSHGELIETWYAKDRLGKAHVILKTPSAEGLPLQVPGLPTAIKSTNSVRLFSAAPSLRFTDCVVKGKRLFLSNKSSTTTILKTIDVPLQGQFADVTLSASFPKKTALEYFMSSYAFVPNGMTLSKGGKPDSTFSPGLRKLDGQVIGDHFFRSPAICAQKGALAALILPDVEHLAENRPMPTILDLDANNGVVDATLMSYGFCDYRLTGHVTFAHNASMTRGIRGDASLRMKIGVTAHAEPSGAYRMAAEESWKVGAVYFDKILPQAMPFQEYAKVCYPAAFSEKQGDNKLGWFEIDMDGHPCGGVMSGWGYDLGWVSWQSWFNNLRSAWGIRWWGKRLGQTDWVEKADKMLNLALAAPLDRGACPTTYQSRQKTWKGSLITPTPQCYYDLTNMAWKGIWLLKWKELPDCPRRSEVEAQCKAMADCMVAHQNRDGSFPSWLDKNLDSVPLLDHSAQSSLPAWYLAEMDRSFSTTKYQQSFLRAADFLRDKVVDQQRYYDFETFFSCSPKQCMQVGDKLDDEAMRDPHTLCPPQNTLCMQWSAEALRAAAHVTRNDAYMKSALKALDMMCLYQNVWPISYRHTAYTYGGFGVQNSDGEYDDARQAQFGATLCDFGAELGRKDYFERGVAATRAALALINHPLHSEWGIYPNPNYPLGIQPENCCHGGTDDQAGRSGFDWGEGSGLTSMAYLLETYGDTYNAKGWSVLVDGGSKGIDMLRASRKAAPLNPKFSFSDWKMAGWQIDGDFAEVPTFSERFDFGIPRGQGFIGTCEDGQGGYDDSYTGTIVSPKFMVDQPISLMVGGGSGPDVFVELIDAKTGEQIYVERGHNREMMDRRVWAVDRLKGRTLQMRVIDHEKGGWGHINVGDIKVGR